MNKNAKGGPKGLDGSREAKKIAVVLLEVLSGVRTTTEATEALQITQARYYQLESRALQGFISSLEPKPRGRIRTPEAELNEMKQKNARLQQELQRHKALVRAAQRSIGLPSLSRARAKDEKNGKRRRKRKSTPRVKRVVAALRKDDGPTKAVEGKALAKVTTKVETKVG